MSFTCNEKQNDFSKWKSQSKDSRYLMNQGHVHQLHYKIDRRIVVFLFRLGKERVKYIDGEVCGE